MLNNELKKNPFTVPDTYFDKLPSKVQDRCIVAKKGTMSGFIPRLAWTGGIMIVVLALFLSYFNFNNIHTKQQQDSVPRTVDVDNRDIKVPEPTGLHKNYLKSRKDAVVDYLVVRNFNLNDYLASKY
jgi:hypothetical protein